jgi:hypothetical protein
MKKNVDAGTSPVMEEVHSRNTLFQTEMSNAGMLTPAASSMIGKTKQEPSNSLCLESLENPNRSSTIIRVSKPLQTHAGA